MIAVSNTTPLRYLIAIDQEDLLGQLFEKVFVPVAVYEELTEGRAPENVRHRVLSPPSWFEVRPIEESDMNPFPVRLHRGERQAILLTEALRADALLLDEQVGRGIAMQRNLPLSGTVGILERADKLGLIRDFPQLLQRLRNSGFFISEGLAKQLLQRHGVRQQAK